MKAVGVVYGSRLRQIGWAMVLSVVMALFLALTFRVNTLRSEVAQAERQIVALEGQTSRLEIEFETRSNQRQLAVWNALDFGYRSPTADQYLDGERQLAAMGEPRGPGAPSPVRLARADIGSVDLPGGANGEEDGDFGSELDRDLVGASASRIASGLSGTFASAAEAR